jgi:hypothetical protein
MADVALSFKLPEERQEFDLARKASDLFLVLGGFAGHLRSHLCHSTNSDWGTATVEKLH